MQDNLEFLEQPNRTYVTTPLSKQLNNRINFFYKLIWEGCVANTLNFFCGNLKHLELLVESEEI
jgi:hypothetical protein